MRPAIDPSDLPVLRDALAQHTQQEQQQAQAVPGGHVSGTSDFQGVQQGATETDIDNGSNPQQQWGAGTSSSAGPQQHQAVLAQSQQEQQHAAQASQFPGFVPAASDAWPGPFVEGSMPMQTQFF